MAVGDSCLNCRRFSECDYTKKSGSYKCKSWKAFSDRKFSLTSDDIFSLSGVSALPEDYTGFKKPKHEGDYHTKEVNLIKMMDNVFSDNNPWPKDMKIDDGDIPEFANIYEYFYDKNYGLVHSMKPFARQLWIGMMLFGDYCPRCSDKKFTSDILNVPVDMKARDFPDKVQFLRFGICPKCKRHKSDMVKKGHMNYYRELAACIGQRAGKSMSFSFFMGYLLHKYLKMQKPSELLTGLPNVTLTATFTATDFKTANETLWQPFCDIINESKWFCIAEGSKVSLADGTTKEIQNLSVGDVVNTHAEPNEVVTLVNTGIQECYDLTLHDGKCITATAEHKIGCLSGDGNSIVWKMLKDVTPEDFVITEMGN